MESLTIFMALWPPTVVAYGNNGTYAKSAFVDFYLPIVSEGTLIFDRGTIAKFLGI